MDSFRLYLHYVRVAVRSQMQYRASFLMLALAHFLTIGTEFFAVWMLFDRFNQLQGWSLAEVALFFGMVNTAFALSEAMARGFDHFGDMVKSGGFDRFLVRPRSTALQVSVREWQLMRLGRFAQGLLVLVLAFLWLDVSWTLAKIGLLAAAIIGGACLFSGIFVIQATTTFWTTETLEIFATVTYGGNETAEYPLSIYRRWFRRFFIYVVPLACISYFPALAILDRKDALGSPRWFQYLSPSVGLFFLVASLQVWKLGVRHYRSTGS
jgi:ABC-2 type transport system permease protein